MRPSVEGKATVGGGRVRFRLLHFQADYKIMHNNNCNAHCIGRWSAQGGLMARCAVEASNGNILTDLCLRAPAESCGGVDPSPDRSRSALTVTLATCPRVRHDSVCAILHCNGIDACTPMPGSAQLCHGLGGHCLLPPLLKADALPIVPFERSCQLQEIQVRGSSKERERRSKFFTPASAGGWEGKTGEREVTQQQRHSEDGGENGKQTMCAGMGHRVGVRGCCETNQVPAAGRRLLLQGQARRAALLSQGARNRRCCQTLPQSCGRSAAGSAAARVGRSAAGTRGRSLAHQSSPAAAAAAAIIQVHAIERQCCRGGCALYGHPLPLPLLRLSLPGTLALLQLLPALLVELQGRAAGGSVAGGTLALRSAASLTPAAGPNVRPRTDRPSFPLPPPHPSPGTSCAR